MKPFPIAVVGAGSQVAEEAADYLPMPGDMAVFRMPVIDDVPRQAAEAAHVVLSELLGKMRAHDFVSAAVPSVDLSGLSAEALAVTNQSLGQGEVSAVVIDGSSAAASWRIEESAFASVWHVLGLDAEGGIVSDHLEVGPVPSVIRRVMAEQAMPTAAPAAAPAGVMNSPAILAELRDQAARWRPGDAAHIVNLSLLPVNPTDLDYLTRALGSGPVTLLSRGYGNCRITSTGLPNTWWVQYFNSMDVLILNTIEVVDVPEAALAAVEDFEDSIERIAEWLETLLDD